MIKINSHLINVLLTLSDQIMVCTSKSQWEGEINDKQDGKFWMQVMKYRFQDLIQSSKIRCFNALHAGDNSVDDIVKRFVFYFFPEIWIWHVMQIVS